MIYAGTNGFVDDYPVAVLGRYEQELLSFMKARKADVLDRAQARTASSRATSRSSCATRSPSSRSSSRSKRRRRKRHAEPQGNPQAHRERQEHAQDHACDEARRGGEAAPRAGRDHRGAPVRAGDRRRSSSELSGVAGKDAHPLFEERELKRAAIVVITSDRGLAGAFNTNVIKAVERYAANELSGATEVSLAHHRQEGEPALLAPQRARSRASTRAPTGANALTVARETANRVDRRLHRRQGRPRLPRLQRVQERGQPASCASSQILPVVPEPTTRREGAATRRSPTTSTSRRRKRCSTRLVPLYVQIQIYRAALESIAAFFGAQMTAMENATKNAGEMIAAHASVQPRSSGGDHQGAARDHRRRRGSQGVTTPWLPTDYSPNSMGRVVQVIGPVVDVAFDSAELPEINTALLLTNPAIDERAGQPDRRGRSAPRRAHGPLRRDGHDRRPRPRPAGEEHQRADLDAGRPRGPRPHPERRRRARRRGRPGQREDKRRRSTARRRSSPTRP